eukprot:CAMPEP_0172549540 /NCGR_PEP_ID=MMETSP1067-20121228/18585_1 /TAXON_ID=265564 ORGANISM="Thalassiosira punctigera, Strain Tpunct2005C2" /NCGR_SAMPLE_ID=MMETSP1067 /ASSEMBLY_ACC=CAM_ASM_000444 /LENGTH=202 /DNA_ID=CAMNT_0013336933 /DNA_START=198 /DNA_END=806 /DNA_ORIENTATION=-
MIDIIRAIKAIRSFFDPILPAKKYSNRTKKEKAGCREDHAISEPVPRNRAEKLAKWNQPRGDLSKFAKRRIHGVGHDDAGVRPDERRRARRDVDTSARRGRIHFGIRRISRCPCRVRIPVRSPKDGGPRSVVDARESRRRRGVSARCEKLVYADVSRCRTPAEDGCHTGRDRRGWKMDGTTQETWTWPCALGYTTMGVAVAA